MRKAEVAILICWLVACSALMFWRSFHVSYGFDDIAHLHALAALRSGEVSTTTWLLHNHNEHIVPLLRLYFMAATRISGLSSSALHVMIFLTYVAGAIACSSIFFSLTRSRLGTVLAGTIYAGAGGFAGSTVWQPTVAQFSVAGTPLIIALAILVSPHARKLWADAAVLVLVVIASLGMGAAAVAALSIPLYLFLEKPQLMGAGRRKLMIALSLLLSAGILLITRWLMAMHGIHTLTFAPKGLLSGLFLLFTVPGRFVLAWVPFAELGLPIDVAASLIGWVLLIVSLRWDATPIRTLLIALWVGDGLLLLLIGMGRYKIATYLDLFTTDRYYFFFLLPLALQTGAVLEYAVRRLLQGSPPARKVAVSVVMGCLLMAALVASHIRLDQGMIWWVIDQHQLDFREAKVLAKIVRATATRQHLHLADGPIHFPGTLNEHLGFSCIIFTQFPKGLPNIQWTLSQNPTMSVDSPFNVPPISDADAMIQNQIFDEWSRKINRPPCSCVIGGKIQDVLPVNSCAEAAKLPVPPLAPVRPFH